MPSVLIVDESPMVQKVVEHILEQRQIKNHYIQNVQDLFGLRGAPCLLRDMEPDAILLDVMMPEINGFDILRKLRIRKDTKNVPVVMMSTDPSAKDQEQAENMGAVAFITKPVEADKLFEALRIAAESAEGDRLQRRLMGDMGSIRNTELDEDRHKAGVADLNYLFDILDGDQDLIAEMIQAFLEASPGQLQDIQEAIDAEDPGKVGRTAHRIKGSVGNFGAPMITDTAFDLEKIGKSGELDKAQSIYDMLSEDVTALCESLQEWVDQRRGK